MSCEYRIGPVRLSCGVLFSEGNSLEELIKNYKVTSAMIPRPPHLLYFEEDFEIIAYINDWFNSLYDRSQFDV